MFIYHPSLFPHSDFECGTEVWVKIANERECSLFVKNDTMVKVSIKAQKEILCSDKWLISDEFYGRMVRKGEFVPLDDLRNADNICEQMGWPKYEIDMGF